MLPVAQQPYAAAGPGVAHSAAQGDAHDAIVVVVEVQAVSAAAVDGPAEVPEELELLKGVNAFAEPGSLLALMGGSGAGKTTLMDVIAGRKTVGRITGDILVNGRPKQQSSWARQVGAMACVVECSCKHYLLCVCQQGLHICWLACCSPWLETNTG
jgi:ABC-type transport system involved in cytochrome bd biosynthesis fused ATPase/permease subunit